MRSQAHLPRRRSGEAQPRFCLVAPRLDVTVYQQKGVMMDTTRDPPLSGRSRVARIVKTMVTAIALGLSLTLLSASVANASSGLHNAAHQTTRKSWTGITIYKVGEEADYFSNGKAIIEWDTAYPWMAAYGLWSYSNAKASWSYKAFNVSVVKGTAHFCLGVSAQWITICVQQEDDWDYAYAYN